MARTTPLLDLHHQGNALLAPYGDSTASTAPAPQLVEAFDPVEIEYAAIRTHAAIFDAPHRATLVLTGPDRLSFLNRMVTQELKGLAPHSARRSFWLNRKGRIDADLRIIELGDRTLIDVDIHAADRARATLEAYIITEDCAIRDESEQWHRVSIHGPAAAALVARLSSPVAGHPVADLLPDHVSVVSIAGAQGIVDRWDMTGDLGLHLLVPAPAAAAVYQALSTPWSPDSGKTFAPTTDLARRIGWHALNIARIEAGTPLYYADFGPDSLPAETGDETLADRVSFKKGCYLGQEVVARMHALGHPKQKLMGLKIDLPPVDTGRKDMFGLPEMPQAVTGTRVLAADAPDALTIGAVTSSCMSPLLGQAHIAIAMIKFANARPDEKVFLQLDDRRLTAHVQGSLRAVNRAAV